MASFGCEDIIWDLTDLFESEQDPRIQAVMDTVLNEAANFEKTYKSRLRSLSVEDLNQAFKQSEALLTPLYKLSQYAGLRNAIDTHDEAIKTLVAHIDDVESTVANHLVFFDLELSSFDKGYLDSLLQESVIKNYAYTLLRSHKTAQYNLNESEEKIINLKDVTGSQGYKKLYSELTASFSFRMELDGKDQVLTGPEIRNLRLHKDQSVRQKAMALFFDEYKKNEITITHIFNYILKDFNTAFCTSSSCRYFVTESLIAISLLLNIPSPLESIFKYFFPRSLSFVSHAIQSFAYFSLSSEFSSKNLTGFGFIFLISLSTLDVASFSASS